MKNVSIENTGVSWGRFRKGKEREGGGMMDEIGRGVEGVRKLLGEEQ